MILPKIQAGGGFNFGGLGLEGISGSGVAEHYAYYLLT